MDNPYHSFNYLTRILAKYCDKSIPRYRATSITFYHLNIMLQKIENSHSLDMDSSKYVNSYWWTAVLKNVHVHRIK